MKKEIIAIAAAAVVLAGLILAFGINAGETKVKFERVSEKAVPREIEADILPSYRDLERALAFKVDDTVYVMVTRGEKPTAGYDVKIEEITLESKDDRSILNVSAAFADPDDAENLAQVICYPYDLVKTDLTGLPDSIQLKADYAR